MSCASSVRVAEVVSSSRRDWPWSVRASSKAQAMASTQQNAVDGAPAKQTSTRLRCRWLLSATVGQWQHACSRTAAMAAVAVALHHLLSRGQHTAGKTNPPPASERVALFMSGFRGITADLSRCDTVASLWSSRRIPTRERGLRFLTPRIHTP